jgi:hypothetical protein
VAVRSPAASSASGPSRRPAPAAAGAASSRGPDDRNGALLVGIVAGLVAFAGAIAAGVGIARVRSRRR